MHVFDYSFLDTGLLPAEMVTLSSTVAAFGVISEERREKILSRSISRLQVKIWQKEK